MANLYVSNTDLDNLSRYLQTGAGPDNMADVTLDYSEFLDEYRFLNGYTWWEATSITSTGFVWHRVGEFLDPDFVLPDYTMSVTGAGIGPVSSFDDFEAALDAGIATGRLDRVSLARNGTEFLALELAPTGYRLVSGNQSLTLAGAVVNSFEQATELAELLAQVDMTLLLQMTEAERQTFFNELGAFGVTGLTLRDGAEVLFVLEVTDAGLHMAAGGIDILLPGTFPQDFGEMTALGFAAQSAFESDGTPTSVTLLAELGIDRIVVRDNALTTLATFHLSGLNDLSDSYTTIGGEWGNYRVWPDATRMALTGDIEPIWIGHLSGSADAYGSGMAVGSAGNDTLMGHHGNDTILGLSGDDFIGGGAGWDIIEGGGGNDTAYGGLGNDTVLGGTGNDVLYGTSGNDFIGGGAGNDFLAGGDDNDTIYGADGNDTIYTGLGSDTVHGGDGNDQIHGAGNRNGLYGGAGDDTIWGGAIADAIGGGDGNDVLLGEGGNDTIWTGAGNDFVGGGDGNDLIVAYTGRTRVYGGTGNDTVYAGTGSDTITGGPGADSFVFTAATLGLGANRDTITDFTSGEDVINLSGAGGSFNGTTGLLGGGQRSTYFFQAGSLLIGDLNGDGVADWALALTGVNSIAAGDLLL